MIKCLNCGETNPDDAKFCSKCGNSLNNSNTNNYQQYENQQFNQKKNNQEKQNNKKIICLGLIVMILLLIIAGTIENSSNISLDDVVIPSGFTLDSRNETQIVFHEYGTPTYVITVTSEDQITPEKLSKGFEDSGYKLQTTKDIKLNNTDITEEKYIFNNNYGYVYNYIIKIGNKKYSISCLTDSENWNINYKTNPVNKIINSMINS